MNQMLIFLLFFVVIVSLFGLMQYRLYRLLRLWLSAVLDPVHREPWIRHLRLLILILNLMFFFQFFLRAGTSYQLPLFQVAIIYPSSIFFAIVVFAFLIVGIADILRFLTRLVRIVILRAKGPQTVERGSKPLAGFVVDEGRRNFLRVGGISVVSTVSALPAFASLTTARDYQINKLDIVSPRLPSGLEGFTIAQVSDIHSGVFMTEENMKDIFDLVNGLKAQMIVVTGDFVDSSDAQIDPLVNAIRMLRADLGVFGCLGNHDHFATAERVSAAVEHTGITMLNNSHIAKTIDGGTLSLIGIDDAGGGMFNYANVAKALTRVEPDSFKIMLTHRPDMWDECRKLDIDFALAGHTHGGQVGFRLGPLNLNPVYLIHKYPMGHFVDGFHHLYVNVGVGMVGVPIRMVKPELSLFTLRQA